MESMESSFLLFPSLKRINTVISVLERMERKAREIIAGQEEDVK